MASPAWIETCWRQPKQVLTHVCLWENDTLETLPQDVPTLC